MSNPNKVTGQDSERYLVAAIKSLIRDGPILLSLGDLGAHEIVDAKSIAGADEPKADIVIACKDSRELGLSMKKENFEFLENWMDEAKLMTRLQQVGMNLAESSTIIKHLRDQAVLLTEQLSDTIGAERDAFIRLIQHRRPDYQYPAGISKTEMNYLASDPAFAASNGKFSVGRFKIPNYYAKLSELFGDRYAQFLQLVIGGGEDNPRKADGVLVADVPANIETVDGLQSILHKIKSVETIVREYKEDPRVNISFRLRPVTLTRTTYSKTNGNKYRIGKRFYENEAVGVSWTVATINREKNPKVS